MAGTPYKSLIRAARFHLNAARGANATYKTDKFWSDDELLDIARRGTTDLWAALIDLHEEHYITVADATGGTPDVTIAASTDHLSGVPADCFRVYLIEPRDISSTGQTRDITFIPRDYNHPEFVNARSWSGQTPAGGLNIFYAIQGVGAPNAAPVVRIAPTLNAAINLRFVYIPTLTVANYTEDTSNPIPGEADNAIIAWVVAYAKGKETQDKMPNAGWLSVYATEKQSLMMRMAPRQEQEAVYVDGLFDDYWSA